METVLQFVHYGLVLLVVVCCLTQSPLMKIDLDLSSGKPIAQKQ